jgi:hypothetical protein
MRAPVGGVVMVVSTITTCIANICFHNAKTQNHSRRVRILYRLLFCLLSQ